MKGPIASAKRSGCGCALLALLTFTCMGFMLYTVVEWVERVLNSSPH